MSELQAVKLFCSQNAPFCSILRIRLLSIVACMLLLTACHTSQREDTQVAATEVDYRKSQDYVAAEKVVKARGGDNQQALRPLAQEIEKHPQNGYAYYLKAHVLYGQGKIDSGLEAIDKAIAYLPAHTSAGWLSAAYLLRAKLYESQMDTAHCQSSIIAAVSMEPENMNAWIALDAFRNHYGDNSELQRVKPLFTAYEEAGMLLYYPVHPFYAIGTASPPKPAKPTEAAKSTKPTININNILMSIWICIAMAIVVILMVRAIRHVREEAKQQTGKDHHLVYSPTEHTYTLVKDGDAEDEDDDDDEEEEEETSPGDADRLAAIQYLAHQIGAATVFVLKDDGFVWFDYKDTTILATIFQETWWMHLSVRYIDNIPLNDIDAISLARKTVNDFNRLEFSAYLFYTIDTERDQMQVHVTLSGLLSFDWDFADAVLRSFAESVLRCRDEYFRLKEQLHAEGE